MTINSFFSISIIDGALNLCRHRKKYPMISVNDAVRQLRSGPAAQASYNYMGAIELGTRVGWDAFAIDGTRHAQLQRTLMNLAIRLKPFWARVSYLGPQRVVQFVSGDQHQCLHFAGLLVTPPSKASVLWWDEIGMFFRMEDHRRRLEIGREGEERTMAHEAERLGKQGICKKPIWIALQDSTAGYDVHSYQRMASGRIDDLRIEVKATRYEPVSFIISRNEWDRAKGQPSLHIFHVWTLENNRLLKLSVTDMASHVPEDHGHGKWKEAQVVLDRFSA